MNRSFVRFISFLLLIGGLILLLNVSLPILSYQIISYYNFQRTKLISPIFSADEFLPDSPQSETYPSNLVRASNWFEGAAQLPLVESKVKYYNIAIPRLKINDAIVEIGGDSLNKSLVQYKGTALPGQMGNAVIFGHSSLPQFFNPSNYLSIFAKLPNMQNGDDIVVNYDGITYRYRVEEMFEVTPTDIEVLAQRFDDSYLTLVTCVPPGTYLRRLIVKARIIPTR